MEVPSHGVVEIPFFFTDLGRCGMNPSSSFHLEDGFFHRSPLFVP